jgi:RNA polymerase sigma-70 factor (ECF subfamily)
MGMEIKDQVEAAIAKLPERQREAIVLCHYQELGNIEAAALMEISVEALESLLSRGRRALRLLLNPLNDRRLEGLA